MTLTFFLTSRRLAITAGDGCSASGCGCSGCARVLVRAIVPDLARVLHELGAAVVFALAAAVAHRRRRLALLNGSVSGIAGAFSRPYSCFSCRISHGAWRRS